MGGVGGSVEIIGGVNERERERKSEYVCGWVCVCGCVCVAGSTGGVNEKECTPKFKYMKYMVVCVCVFP